VSDAGGEIHGRFARTGAIGALADAIEAGTGSKPHAPGGHLAAALAAAFPGLPPADGLEGCASHPALTAHFRVPGLGRESVKVVLVPRSGALEARVRLVIPDGSYRRETLLRILEHGEAVERALGGGEGREVP